MTVQQTWNPDAGAHCLIDLRFAGRDYFKGETFPHPDDGELRNLDQATVRAMWAGGRIGIGPAPDKLAELAVKRAKSKEGKERDKARKARIAEREARERARQEAEDEAELARLEAEEAAEAAKRPAGVGDDVATQPGA